MESLVDVVLTGENLRTIILLVVIIGGFLLQNAKMDKRFGEVEAKMDTRFVEVRAEIAAVEAKMDRRFVEVDKHFAEVQAAFDHLKINDFGHLGNAFKNLTYVLMEKNLIDERDKTFIDQALDG
jgi:hypothetical protein